MNLPILTSRSRVMFFAPHPDDESLAGGIFLQRVVSAGARVQVLYATDGERNCWPQRVLEGKVRIRENDRRRWGTRRRAEALTALRTLGIDAASVKFLSLPDQRVTDLLLEGCRETLQRLANTIRSWRPTHLIMPSAADTHPDHSGLAILLRVAIEDHLPPQHAMAQIHYLVHGASKSFAREAHELPSSPIERKTKRRAITCHVTQVALSRRRFLGYAKRPERFTVGGEKMVLSCDGPIRSFVRHHGELRLHVAFNLRPLRAERTFLYLVGNDAFNGVRRLRATLPGRSSNIELIDCTTGAIAGVGLYQGDAFSAEIFLPLNNFAVNRAVFVKLDRRVWFFDEAGWIEIPSPLPQLARSQTRELASRELAVA